MVIETQQKSGAVFLHPQHLAKYEVYSSFVTLMQARRRHSFTLQRYLQEQLILVYKHWKETELWKLCLCGNDRDLRDDWQFRRSDCVEYRISLFHTIHLLHILKGKNHAVFFRISRNDKLNCLKYLRGKSKLIYVIKPSLSIKYHKRAERCHEQGIG